MERTRGRARQQCSVVISRSKMDISYLLNPTSLPSATSSSASSSSSQLKRARRFPCEQCGYIFGMRSNLKRHILTVHEEQRRYACKFCNKAFGLKQNLTTHVRVKHEKARPFRCEICMAAFGYKQVLVNHRRNIHGEKRGVVGGTANGKRHRTIRKPIARLS